jgi:hypothetical protein
VHRASLANEERVLSTVSGTFSFMHSQGLCVAEANGNGVTVEASAAGAEPAKSAGPAEVEVAALNGK